ncbi:nuclear factor 7, ovary-like [Brachyhypopomus gauderio]|uniref:nuclear factor 7, ovary-like n=1 Tax=Brachyhypopomus gauderio TaxID=698409 RepID=UPI0040425D9F
MATALSQHISCPVCLTDLRDPVSLPCEHVYCRECIANHLAESGDVSRCPVCRQPFTRDHVRRSRFLRNIVEATQAHLMEHEAQRASMMHAQEQAVTCDPAQRCPFHNQPFKLVCETDNELICDICREESVHQGHQYKSLKDAFQERKEKTSDCVAILLTEDENLVDLIEEQTVEIVKTRDKTTLLSEQISAEFEMLHKFLIQQEGEVMKLLYEKQNQNFERMEKNLHIMEEKLSDRREKQGVLMSALENEQPCQYLQWWKERGQTLTGKILNPQPLSMTLSAQGFSVMPDSLFLGPYETHLQFFMWKKMLRSIQPVPHHHTVEDEGDQSIKISPSGLSVQHRKNVQMRNESSTSWLRADTTYGTGQHYWEVEVGQKADWGVGVCSCRSNQADKDAVLCRSSESGYYIQQASNADKKHVDIALPPRKIGVYLDCQRRQVSFYNADSMVLIDTITLLKSLPHSLCVSPGLYLHGTNSDALTLCWY